MIRIAHLSDVHFGRIAYPEIVAALVAEVNAAAVDLVVVSGDLTQRARPRQFEEAVAMLDAFTAPVLVVPGNHDVYAWWHRPLLRMFQPLRRYRQYVTDNLRPTFEQDGVAVLGINSAYGYTIKGGWIGEEARQRIVAFFKQAETGSFKILVLHHHLMNLAALGRHDIARRARPTLEAAVASGVDLVLCGHLHVSHMAPVETSTGRLIIASAGTATCNRWREPQLGENYYTMLGVTPDEFVLEERRYEPASQRFISARRTPFAR